MRALSLDLRERIAQVVQHDPMATYPQIAARFAVSVGTVERISRKLREGQSLVPKQGTGRRPKVAPEQMQAFEQLAASRTDWTLQSLADAWQEQEESGGVALSQATVSRMLAKIRFSHKKSAESPPRETKPSDKPSRSR